MRDLMGPMVHLNGTSGEELIRQMRACVEALGGALNALYTAAPNARDYYPLGDCAFATARAQHEGWIAAVADVQRACMALLDGIVDQQEERSRSRLSARNGG
jgi:hypothetical protein